MHSHPVFSIYYSEKKGGCEIREKKGVWGVLHVGFLHCKADFYGGDV
ncbi:MAG: hypothetical protein H6P94_1103 [Thermoplasmatales archaeon]|nr:hypothetical protein [Thermoplasmatales archaeon]